MCVCVCVHISNVNLLKSQSYCSFIGNTGTGELIKYHHTYAISQTQNVQNLRTNDMASLNK